jgi:hypothetical protein
MRLVLKKKKKKKKLSACRGEGSAVGLQLRVRFVPAALLEACGGYGIADSTAGAVAKSERGLQLKTGTGAGANTGAGAGAEPPPPRAG